LLIKYKNRPDTDISTCPEAMCLYKSQGYTNTPTTTEYINNLIYTNTTEQSANNLYELAMSLLNSTGNTLSTPGTDLKQTNISGNSNNKANISDIKTNKTNISGNSNNIPLKQTNVSNIKTNKTNISGSTLNTPGTDLKQTNISVTDLKRSNISDNKTNSNNISGSTNNSQVISGNSNNIPLKQSNISGSALKQSNISGTDLKQTNNTNISNIPSVYMTNERILNILSLCSLVLYNKPIISQYDISHSNISVIYNHIVYWSNNHTVID
ncbi:hypothetical protein NEAUS04_2772, partial [Nematocida ausubeli]